MSQLSFIHTADLHLDAPFSSLSDTNKAVRRRRDLEACFRKIVNEAQHTELLLISGDFFEDNSVLGSTVLTIKNLFSELYKSEIIICPGNHDPLKVNSPYKNQVWGNNVHILEDVTQVLYLEKYNTCIYTLGSRGSVKEDLQILKEKNIPENCFNILLFHGTVDMPFEEENYNAISSQELFSLGMDYIALGHMHNYIQKSNGKCLMINPGSPEPLGFDEGGQHGYIKGTMTFTAQNIKSIETEYIPSASRQYHSIEINVTGGASDTEILQQILKDRKISFNLSDLYSITLKGFLKKDYMPDISKLIAELKDLCFFIKLKNQTYKQFDVEEYLEDPGIKGEFVRRIMDKMETALSQEKRETLFMALQYGLQAMEGGRIEG